jgi:hypothetical protein
MRIGNQVYIKLIEQTLYHSTVVKIMEWGLYMRIYIKTTRNVTINHRIIENQILKYEVNHH